MGLGGINGAWQYLKQNIEDITNAPESVRAIWSAIEKARLDPAAATTALEIAVAKAGPEARRLFQESQAMARLLERQGDVRGATELTTLAAIAVFDPAGRILKGTKYADGLAKSIAQNAALNKLNGMVGTTTAMPSLSTIARNDGMLAEGIAAHFTRELGVEVKVLQNASGHGVDLHAFDATLNRFIVIEVKSSTSGGFGPLPTGSPEDFLRSRAAKAAQGQGFWKPENVPKATRDDATAIGDNFRRNAGTSSAPTVVGYKYEISIPKPGQSGAPTLTVNKW